MARRKKSKLRLGRRPKKRARGLIFALLSVPLLFAGLCLPFAGSFWLCDILASLALPLATLCMLVGCLGLIARVPMIGVMTLVTGLSIFGTSFMRERAPAGTTADATVLVFNAYAENPEFTRSLAMLRASSADVVLLNELSQSFAEAVRTDAELLEKFPHRQLPEHENQWRRAVLSKWPLTGLEERDDRWKELRFEYIYRRAQIVNHPESPFAVTVIVPSSPRSPSRWADGNERLRKDAELINAYVKAPGLPLVIGADMNGSPTSYRTKLVASLTGLRRAKPMLKFVGTWPSTTPAFVRIAIDDLLLSDDVRVVSWETVEAPTDSDHVPVLIGIDLPAPHALATP